MNITAYLAVPVKNYGSTHMKRRYLAFDIETAKDFPGEGSDWRSHRPLGISCAATLASDTAQLQLWHGKGRNGRPAVSSV